MLISFDKNLTIKEASEINGDVLKISLVPNLNQANSSKLDFNFKHRKCQK